MWHRNRISSRVVLDSRGVRESRRSEEGAPLPDPGPEGGQTERVTRLIPIPPGLSLPSPSPPSTHEWVHQPRSGLDPLDLGVPRATLGVLEDYRVPRGSQSLQGALFRCPS